MVQLNPPIDTAIAVKHGKQFAQTSARKHSHRTKSFVKPDFEGVNQACLSGFQKLLEQWLPGGRRQGNEYVCGDLNGGPGGSMSVNITTGKWSDFATGEKGGDPVSLYAAINGMKMGDAARELSNQFGLGDTPPIQRKKSQDKKPQVKVVMPVPDAAGLPDCHHFKHGSPSQMWCYRDEQGQVLQFVARYDLTTGGKQYFPWTWNGTGWQMKHPTSERPLYGLEKLAARPDAPVVICEGEKAVDAAQRQYPDAVFVTWSSGSSSVKQAYWEPLHGRDVTIWPDADDAGTKAAEDVVLALKNIAASVGVADVSDKPDKWDAADAEEDGWTADDVAALLNGAETTGAPKPLSAKTYDGSFDPAGLPVRGWIIYGLLLRGYITAVLAPPGVGKSLFALVIAIMVATGRKIISKSQRETTNVLYINNEDDQEEIDRRVAGICQQQKISFDELDGKLFTLSGYGNPLLIAHKENKDTVVAHLDAERVSDFCNVHNIGTIILDPFISTHDVSENDNTEVDKVVQEYRGIAKATGAAIILVHHTRKTGSDTESHAGDEQSGRGAYSLVAATRIAFTLARMSKDTAKCFGIDWENGNRLIRMDDGKMNFALKDDKADWYELVSVEIGNGDSVGVPVPFDMDDITKRIEEEKNAAKAEHKKIKITEIAREVAVCMNDDEQPQGEVLAAYRAHTDKGKTASNDDVALLPVGRENAIKVTVDKVPTRVWRVNIGTSKRRLYTIHKEAEE